MIQPRLVFALLLVGPAALTAVIAQGPPPPIKGTVVDAEGQVSGAKVRWQGECQFAVTDAKGEFQLPPSKSNAKRLTAWKQGHAIGAATSDKPPITIQLLPLPTRDEEDYQWIDPTPNPKKPTQCGNCHQQIHKEWASSAHGHSATNKRFVNLFGGTDWHGKPSAKWNVLGEHPLGSAVCASCHAPTFDDPNLDYDMRSVPGVARHGVHCDYCHKIIDAPTDKLGQRFGRDGLVLLRPKGDQLLFFGPLDDAFRQGESFGYLPLYKESRYCASCHEGVIFGVHVYGTYSEWLKSPAKEKGQQCQSCHMTPTGQMTNFAPGKGGIERDPLTLASHHLPGATPEMLRDCLSVHVQVKPAKNTIQVNVEVLARNVGHRVPTGFIDRNLILVVEGLDKQGAATRSVKGSLLPGAAGKQWAGKPGYLYAKLLHDPQGRAPMPFWLVPRGQVIDTRLQPEQADHRNFQFVAGTTQVRVRLLYRRFWPDVAQSKSWPDDEIEVLDKKWNVLGAE